jgi:hypothetical protein
MQRSISFFCLTALLAALIGCSGFDKTVILVHPETAAPSSTIDVALVNLYTYLASGSTVPETVERDSLHLLVGRTGAWEVVEVKMAVVDDMTAEQLFALQGNMQDPTAISSLLDQYRDQAVLVSSDGSLAEALGGQTMTAHNQTNEENIDVDVDAIARWDGFSAPVNIVLEQGSTTDTVMMLDSVVALVGSTGLVADSLMEEVESQLNSLQQLVPDSIGISMIPVALFLQIKAGDQETDDTLFYFSKTGMMNPIPNAMITQLAPEMSGIEMGDMTFMPISVTGGSAILRRTGTDGQVQQFSISADPGSGMVKIRPGVHLRPFSIFVYSLSGVLVQTLAAGTGNTAVIWDGTDAAGNRVGAGSYFIRVTSGAGTAEKTVQLVR